MWAGALHRCFDRDLGLKFVYIKRRPEYFHRMIDRIRLSPKERLLANMVLDQCRFPLGKRTDEILEETIAKIRGIEKRNNDDPET